MLTREQLNERNFEWYGLWKSGVSFAEIGRRYNRHRETVRAMCHRCERILKYHPLARPDRAG